MSATGAGVSATLRVSRIQTGVLVLGPGTRSVLWVAGCEIGCAGCIAPELFSPAAGRERTVADVADELLSHPTVDGVTYSGGEPTDQAAALVALTDLLRSRRPGLSVMAYSGRTLRQLVTHGTPAQRDLLQRLDILVDGPYVASRHRSLLWRASANQDLVLLSRRHRAALVGRPDASAGLQVKLDADGTLVFAGVPPVPDFRRGLADAQRAAGLHVTSSERPEDDEHER